MVARCMIEPMRTPPALSAAIGRALPGCNGSQQQFGNPSPGEPLTERKDDGMMTQMERLPIIICTSVVRSTRRGESHGGIYLVDLETENIKQVVDWNDQTIDWSGRGVDRGLRGIAFYGSSIVAAASDEVFFYDQEFNIVNSITNRYLKHCHEIHIKNDTLFLSSTGYDSILLYNLKEAQFEKGYCYRMENSKTTMLINRIAKKLNFNIRLNTNPKPSYYEFCPESNHGPTSKDTHHINNIFCKDDEIYFSGTRINKLMRIKRGGTIEAVAPIPMHTHNVQYFGEYLLINETSSDAVSLFETRGNKIFSFNIVHYDSRELTHTNIPHDHARQGFGRGLCTYKDLILGGSSPATISIYTVGRKQPIKTIQLSNDIRNAIHGLEVYPYPFVTG